MKNMTKLKNVILLIYLIFFSINLFAAQTKIDQVNGLMCINC